LIDKPEVSAILEENDYIINQNKINALKNKL
jgi:hypothetical protein